MKRKYWLLALLFLLMPALKAQTSAFSTAGFYEKTNTGREVFNMNVGWRFYKGKASKAMEKDYDDSSWERVSLPHGLELLPEEASGCINYQGEAWYRKRFTLDNRLRGKKVFLHFEAIMGKSKVWMNGVMVKEHFGGFLPVIADLTPYLVYDKPNQLSVCADNSDDPLFPPGKPQQALDFAYFGGIYRDCWLVAHNQLYITNPNYESVQAGGGLLVHYPKVTDTEAIVGVKLQLRNEDERICKGTAHFALKDTEGRIVATSKQKFNADPKNMNQIESSIKVKNPQLWSPDSPTLYSLEVTIEDAKGNIVDGYSNKVGIRKIEFRGKDGLWINGKPFNDKLIGVNRHQDFAIIGNALPNSLHWRDIKKMRDAGMRVIRSAHYPQDPAFMDACDELGMLIIVNTPGWQFWNNEPIFAQRIYSDIRNMVRRDRNHPSLFFWEPVLNETHFPEDFAIKAKQCVESEYPYWGGNYTACDPGSKGSENYPIIYSHPLVTDAESGSAYTASTIEASKVYFTREFGDNVDDWNSHNSNSRVHRSWGETPMLIQANHYAHPDYSFTCLESLYASGKYHIGGALWHSFDHQRGYHPQPFYGGIMDAFRQPKTSYYLFMAQRPVAKPSKLPAEGGPMVYIAHQMTPFSSSDVTVYSNCEEVRLTVFEGGKRYTYHRSSSALKMPSPIITFKNAFDFMALKALSRAGKQKQVYLLAEGIQGGKVVATYKRMPSLRPSKLMLRVDDNNLKLKADGSDIVTIIAEVADENGNVKRLSNYSVKFTVEGEARKVPEAGIENGLVKVQWGSAPLLIQSTRKAGAIRIRAEIQCEGVNAIEPCTLTLYSTADNGKFIYDESIGKALNTKKTDTITPASNDAALKEEVARLKKKLSEYELKEVEKQQNTFGEQR